MEGRGDRKVSGVAGADASAPSGRLPAVSAPYTPEELVQLERQERLGGWLVLFFAGAALATAALAFYLFAEGAEQNDEYVRIDRPEETAGNESPFVWGEPSPEAAEAREVDTSPAATASSAVPPPALPPPQSVGEEQVFDFPGPPQESSIPTFAGPPPGSVDRETARALRNGKAELWREKGERGYVLVSDPVTYGTRECRQVSYTRFENGGQATSPSSQWCRVGDSTKWRPDSRGPE